MVVNLERVMPRIERWPLYSVLAILSVLFD
jgi:hypothetical protein